MLGQCLGPSSTVPRGPFVLNDDAEARMARLDDHRTVIRFRQNEAETPPKSLDVAWLRQVCLDAGADDVGFVAVDRPELDDQRPEILALLPGTRALISLVCRMNREPIRSPARSVANLEFHRSGEHVNDV